MPPLTDFATEASPIRCSALPLLASCPLRAVLLYLGECADESGKAADTGSAVHAAIYNWHRNGQDHAAALAAMEAGAADYPLADFHDAKLSFTPYTRDPRNILAKIVAQETSVVFSLAPAPHDPTGKSIWVKGRLDQIRDRDGFWYLDDVKTGKKYDGFVMMAMYAMQIAAYAIGASKLYNRPVMPGAIIRTYGYRTRGADRPESEPHNIFFNYAWGLNEADRLLDTVRNRVADIRAGRLYAVPGDYCSYCPAGGLDSCLPALQPLTLRSP